MTRISLVEHPEDEQVQATISRIESLIGAVPSLFRVYAHHPALMEANWNKVEALMMHGCLSAQLKESMALAICAANNCDYGIYHYSMTLESMGMPREEVMVVRTDPDNVHFSDGERALFNLARHGASAPHDHGERLIAKAQQLGAGDREIVETLGIMEMVLGFIHVVEMLGMEPHRDRDLPIGVRSRRE
ncbi:carboxymuconolactone decarboxylase family protein [Microbulbifer halophilus]|uniref:Carboxymuconolactone decarboxylase family protein n=1 Tax=Microbulbifer halophilus TaxID=453963 RepID=A0ABW5EGM2_9GAMM|nr:carboxymuconolactone decarboxylase family protein [Microbulbifer halophilus]MCW8128330.1 carboxymuconolactone decarboxylase family protein [Microbulbifer halophilus]